MDRNDDYSINDSWKPILWGLPLTHRLPIDMVNKYTNRKCQLVIM